MAKSSYLTSIANKELISLKDLIQQKTTVATEFWEKFGTSGFYFSLLAFRDDPSETDLEEMKASYNDFMQLCAESPDTDPDVLMLLSSAYVNLCLAATYGTHALSERERVEHLLSAVEAKVMAIQLPLTYAHVDNIGSRKAMLSAAGSKGMKSRYRPFEELRKHVREYAPKVAHKNISSAVEIIVAAISPMLHKASKDPHRIVKDTLRKERTAIIKPHSS